jgi:hypothetical protein
MDGQDVQRRVGDPRRNARTREGIEELRRGQRPPLGGSAQDCLKAGRDPERKFEPLRRGEGGEQG